MADDAFASFERKWLDANPEQSAVLIFLDAPQRRRASAFGTLVHELSHTAFGVRESSVAAAKLAWWREELDAASAGVARHPISRELFVDEQVRSIGAERWRALIEGAFAQLDPGPPASFDDAATQLSAFYMPVAEIEIRLESPHSHDVPTVAALWNLSHMLHSLASGAASHEHARLPLDVLARHRVSRAEATGSVAVLKDFLGEIQLRLVDELEKARAAPLGRRVRARSDRFVIGRALRSADPAAGIAQLHRFQWRHVLWSWREARHRARLALEDTARSPS